MANGDYWPYRWQPTYQPYQVYPTYPAQVHYQYQQPEQGVIELSDECIAKLAAAIAEAMKADAREG